MSIRINRFVAAGLLVAGAARAAAVPVPQPAAPLQSVPGQAAPAADEAVAAALTARAFETRDETERLDLLDQALAAAPRPTRFRGEIQCIRASVLNAAKRKGDALSAGEECVRLLPDLPVAALQLGAILDETPGRDRGTMMIVAALEQQPQLALAMPEYEIDAIVRRLGYLQSLNGYRRFAGALVAGGYADAHPATAGPLVQYAVAAELDGGNVAGAVKLLGALITPDALLPMLIGNRYRAIWSNLEDISGGDFHAQRVASVAAAKGAYQRQADAESRDNYANALADAGYVDDAAALLRKVVDDTTQWGDERWPYIMAVTRLARVLETSRRFDEALDVRARALATTPIKRFPQIANVAMNQARLLATLGRSKEADVLVDGLVAQDATKAPEFEGPGAMLWFDAIHACSADPAVARPASARSKLGRPINREAFRFALACSGNVAALVAETLISLDKPAERDGLIYALRRYQVDTRPLANSHDQSRRAVAADPTITKRLDALSRLIPAGYRAAAQHWQN